MVHQVIIQVKGIKRVLKGIRTIRKRTPKVLDRTAEFLAKEVQRRARISFSMQFNKRTGTAWESIQAYPISRKNPFTWGAMAGRGGAEHYIMRLEEARAIQGWHFKPKQGAGYWGEGIALPGGQIPIRMKGRFMRTAAQTVNRDAEEIAARRYMNMVKRSGF